MSLMAVGGLRTLHITLSPISNRRAVTAQGFPLFALLAFDHLALAHQLRQKQLNERE
jgi:hypothetical protein